MFYDRLKVDIVGRIINANVIISSHGDTGGSFSITGKLCSKFALLDTHPEHDAISLLYLMSKVLMSDKTLLPRFRVAGPPFVSINFFTEPYLHAVAALEQSGILKALNIHMKRLETCINIINRGNRLENLNYEAHRGAQPIRRCLTQNSGTSIYPSKLKEVAYPFAISLQTLQTTFKSFMVGFVVASIIFLFEDLAF